MTREDMFTATEREDWVTEEIEKNSHAGSQGENSPVLRLWNSPVVRIYRLKK